MDKVYLLRASLILIALFGVNFSFSQSAVINKYRNTSSSADIIELLVVQDNADLRNLIIKDFTASNANDGGGSITFNNIAFWTGLRAGTLIVITANTGTANDIVTSCTDFNLNIGGSNATYFTAIGSFDLADNDMCMIKSGSSTGATNNIHTLRAGSAGAQWTGISGGSTIGTTSTLTGSSTTTDIVYVSNAGAVLADFNLGTSGAALGGSGTMTFGSGNNSTNTNFINLLRGPISSAASSITLTGFTANWATITGSSSYRLDVSTVSDFSALVSGYSDLNVGNVTSYGVTGLLNGTTYYYRIRVLNATPTTSGNSCSQTVTTVAPPTTIVNGDWNTGATWSTGSVPLSSDNVIINHNITSTGGITRNSGTTTTINALKSLAVSATYTNSGTTTVNGTFQLNSGGWATGNNFIYGAAGTLIFNSSTNYGVNNGDVFWPAANGPFDVKVPQGGITMNATTVRSVSGTFIIASGSVNINSPSSLILNGFCYINSGGSFNNSPIFGNNSTLIYNSGTSGYGRGLEWIALGVGTIGVTVGYPNNVQISGATSLDYNNGTPLAKAMNGNLTIDSGSSFYMDWGGGASGGTLTVAGDIYNSGTLKLGNTSGDDLKIAGNFSNTGTFNGNGRAVYFIKNGTQTISSTGSLTIPYVVFQPASGSTTVQLLSNLIVSAVGTGNAISFSSSSDIFDINGNTLTVGTAGISNGIIGGGSFKGSTTSNLSLQGTGSVGTLSFTSGFQNLGTLTVNRSSGAIGITLGTAVTMNSSLALSNGIADLGNNTMTIGSAGTITGASAGNYIIADAANGSSASLNKVFSAAGTFSFPIGDGTASVNGSQYSPISVTFAGGTYGGFAGFAVDDIKEPNMNAPLNYISRYWTMASSGISPTNYSVTGIYLPIDIAGTENLSISSQWNGSVWSNGGAALGLNTLNLTGLTALPAVNHIGGGLRDAEINVVQGSTNYATGSTYSYGTVLTGSSTGITFTIQNIGQQNLTLSAATFSGGSNYFYTTAYSGGSIAALGSQTFVVTFTPSGAGTFTGSISIPNSDSDENPYIINFSGIAIVPAPEINLQAASGGLGNISSGSLTAAALNNTLFGSAVIGASITKDFNIQNISSATAVLTLTGTPRVSIGGTNPGDFTVTTVPPSSSLAIGASTTFVITFTPIAAGIRTAIVSIANNDSDENPYTYLIQGTGTCAGTANTVTPASGPVGTEVIVTATTNNLTGATATFNLVSAVVTAVSTTQVKVIIPSGAASGQFITTNSQGCTATNYFTVITNAIASCQGTGSGRSTLFISEITDHPTGSHSYVEIFNATGGAVNLLNYTLRIYHNGGGAPTNTITLPSYSLANNTAYVVAFGSTDSTTNPGGITPDLTNNALGINSDDNIRLYDSTSAYLDLWGDTTGTAFTIAAAGYTYRRKNVGITAPSTTWASSDWSAITPVEYSNVGLYDYSVGTPPPVTVQPVYSASCKATTLTVAGTEGYGGGLSLAYQWYSIAPNVATWTSMSDGGIYSGVGTATLAISNLSGLDGYQYYCQIRENSVTCYSASNAVKIIEAQTVTWNGSVWTPISAPTIATIAVVNGNYNTTTNGSFEACSVSVNAGFTLTITPSQYVSIQNDLTVATSANLIVQNQGSLVQIDNAGVNTGNISYKRDVNIKKYDYVYWSAPVGSFPVTSLSPTTLSAHIWKWLPQQSSNFGGWTNANENMTKGKGYIVRGPSGFDNITAQTFTATFSGIANSGVISAAIERGGYQGIDYTNPSSGTTVTRYDDNWNLIGNPYPSAIKSLDFLTYNTNIEGAVRLWTHGSLPATGVVNPFYGSFLYNYNSNDYIVYNGTGTSSGPTGFNGYIAGGQGFFVLMNDGIADNTQTVVFNNAMRNKGYSNSQFYRSDISHGTHVSEKGRIWLDLVGSSGSVNRTLVGYVDNATYEKDRMYDACTQLNNQQNFYSLIDNLPIDVQGRPTPFDDNDVVPLGFKLAATNTCIIAIAAVDGLFNSASQAIFLEDKLLNIIHDLRQAPYTFTAETGRFDNRFVLRYTNSSLGVENFEVRDSSVIVSADGLNIKVKSENEPITAVAIYDILGRTIFASKDIGSNSFSTDKISAKQQALIVKTTLANHQVVSRKIIY